MQQKILNHLINLHYTINKRLLLNLLNIKMLKTVLKFIILKWKNTIHILLENSVFLFIINVGAQNGEAIGKSKRV